MGLGQLHNITRFFFAVMVIVVISLTISGCVPDKQNIDKQDITSSVNEQSQIVNEPKSKAELSVIDVDRQEPDESEPSDEHFTFNPSGPDFIKNIIDERGSVEITEDMRGLFNLFARDYRLVYMPEMNYYESFFEANQYAESFGYNNFGFAVFYVLQYMRCPEKMSSEDMQKALQDLFVAKKDYKDMPHQAYRKLANYEDGYYSPWPEGGLDHDRMFYLLTAMDVVQDGPHVVYLTLRYQNYYFNDTNLFEPGDNEKWLAEKSEELGVPDLQAAEKLITSGEMKEIEAESEFETTIYIKFSGQNPYGFNPRFVSNRMTGGRGC